MTICTIDDGRERPGSPGLASSTRRRPANDEINAHRMRVAMTVAVVVVASVTPCVTHTMLASDIRRSINERSRRLDWDDHCEDLDESGPDCLGFSTGCLSRPSKKLADILHLQPLRDRRFLALLDVMMGCIHQQCCTERERVFYRKFRTPRSPIALSDSKIPCRHHVQVDYELCVCVCCVCFFPFILDIKFVGRTSRGHTGGRSHKISHPPSFCGTCLDFSREKDPAFPFPRRP